MAHFINAQISSWSVTFLYVVTTNKKKYVSVCAASNIFIIWRLLFMHVPLVNGLQKGTSTSLEKPVCIMLSIRKILNKEIYSYQSHMVCSWAYLAENCSVYEKQISVIQQQYVYSSNILKICRSWNLVPMRQPSHSYFTGISFIVRRTADYVLSVKKELHN